MDAVPSAGYGFVNWTENGSPVSTGASYTFFINNDRNLVANFVPACGTCPGDMNGDNYVDGRDIPLYISCLFVGTPATPACATPICTTRCAIGSA